MRRKTNAGSDREHRGGNHPNASPGKPIVAGTGRRPGGVRPPVMLPDDTLGPFQHVGEPLSILLVEDDADDALRMRDLIASGYGTPVRVDWVTRLAEALDTLRRDAMDVVLLDLSLPDGQGMDVFRRVQEAAPDAAIIVIEETDHRASARAAVVAGAYDRLDRRRLDPYWLPRALRYIAAHKATETHLRDTETRCRALDEAAFEYAALAEITLDSIGDAVLATDLEGTVTFINRVAENLTGWPRDEAVGHALPEVFRIVDGTSQLPAPNPARLAIDEDSTVGLDSNCMLIRADGSQQGIEDSAAPIHSRNGEVVGAVIVFRDAHRSLMRREELVYLAQHDRLTRLADRALFSELFDNGVRLARRHGRQLAVLFIDLDNFKTVNDRYGHSFADELLRSVAQRLTDSVRDSDTVCRYGGDEFVILFPEIDGHRALANSAQRLLDNFAVPHCIDGVEYTVDLSIGISVFPDDTDTGDPDPAGAILTNADFAMYRAKANGRNNYHFYEPGDRRVPAAEGAD